MSDLDDVAASVLRHQFGVRDGTVTEPPAVFPIDTYEVIVRGKSVYVEFDD